MTSFPSFEATRLTMSRSIQRPRLLFLCQVLPYPPDGGVRIRAFHLVRILSASYEVHVLCFYRDSGRTRHSSVRERMQALREDTGAVSVRAFAIPQERSRLRFVWDHARSVLTGRPYTVFTYESSEFQDRLHKLLREQAFDVIHVDSLDLSRHLKRLPDTAVICDHHNIESSLLVRRARRERSRLRRMYMMHQARLVAREEARWYDQVELNLVVSDEDRRRLLNASPAASAEVVPNGVDTTSFEPHYGGGGDIVFVGGYTWFPNRDGMEYFAKRILPLIRHRLDDVTVHWIGRAAQDVAATFRESYGIEMTGYVTDIRPYVEDARCMVVPLRVGGGTRLKILDAWAMGKAVVSTSQGCEGLAIDDGENILVRDDEQDFADAVAEVLTNDDLRVRLGRGGRRTAEREYDWSVVGRRLIESLDVARGVDDVRS